MPVLAPKFSGSIALRGVVAASYPKLHATVLNEHEGELTLPVPGAPTLVVRTRVLRSAVTGLLDFDYNLGSISADYDHELRMNIMLPVHGLEIVFADFRVDGPGVIPPVYFESSKMEPAVFRFTYGLSVGRDTRRCVISTNTREFTESGGTLQLICHNKRMVSVDVPMPLGVMATIPKLQPTTVINDEAAGTSVTAPEASTEAEINDPEAS